MQDGGPHTETEDQERVCDIPQLKGMIDMCIGILPCVCFSYSVELWGETDQHADVWGEVEEHTAGWEGEREWDEEDRTYSPQRVQLRDKKGTRQATDSGTYVH